ncbi:MAG: hypothetical protein KDB14_24860 [Planctomycetales bacterium]|nr:hypothetical protein [Planctomycetales bacterium]
MSPKKSAFFRLDDEAFGRQYEVRITYDVASWDAGDFTTPPAGGTASLSHVEVLQVRHFDGEGNVSGIDIGAAARRFDSRAWELVDEGVLTRPH